MSFEVKDIVFIGESLGTGVAVKMATEYPQAQALVLESPYTSLATLGQRHMKYLPVYLLMRDRYNSLGRIKDIKMPVLVLHGQKDRIVPFSFGQKLYHYAPQPKRMEVFPLGHHLDLYQYGAADKVMAFLKSLDQFKMNAEKNATKER